GPNGYKLGVPPEPPMIPIRLIAVSLAACGLAACASSNVYTGADAGVHHFNQIGRRPPAPAVKPAAQPSTQMAAATPPVRSSSAPLSAAPDAAASAPVAPGQGSTQLALAAPLHSAAPAQGGAASLDEARRRVIALLSAEGFDPEPDSRGVVISASRMATANDDAGEAVCGVRALSRPRMYAANVDVRLAPGAQGVEVGVDAHFEEMDQNLVSGELSKHACASRGVLEAQVRRAATGG
ncbi:MAG: hypothetical protein ACYDD1_19865, partial [Caulobacteraceae bacterium]